MNSPLDWIDDELRQLGEQHLLRRRRVFVHHGGGRSEIDGRPVLDFSANDYLDLATDPRLKQAGAHVVGESGLGARASALVSGVHPWHDRLRQQLAEFEQTESAVLFPTGFAANQGTVAALVGEPDVVFCDKRNHASLVDGCRLSRAKFRVYRHDDLETLRRELEKAAGARRRLIATDGLFSMDGDLAPLPELWELARALDAMLLVDEAHATGVFGPHGRGTVEHFGLEGEPIVRVGTLSKALGALGGFVAGSETLCDWLWNRARTQIYSTALPAVLCAAACEALRIVQTEPERRTGLQELADHCRQRLDEAGLAYPAGAVGPVIPVLLADPERALNAGEQLLERGFLVGAIRPPTVPQGTSRLRISLCSGHTPDDIDQLVATLQQVL